LTQTPGGATSGDATHGVPGPHWVDSKQKAGIDKGVKLAFVQDVWPWAAVFFSKVEKNFKKLGSRDIGFLIFIRKLIGGLFPPRCHQEERLLQRRD
jgi:hypothetical protein